MRRKRYHQGTKREHANVENVNQTAPENIGQLGHQRSADQVEQHVDGEDPGFGPIIHTEKVLDGSEGGGDDGYVEGAHQHAQEEYEHYTVASFVVHGGGKSFGMRK